LAELTPEPIASGTVIEAEPFMTRTILGIVLATSISACSGDNPTAPSPAPTGPTDAVQSITVSTAGSDGVTFQMRAMAARANGSSSDVTALAQWETSNPELASVAAGGTVTALASGEIEVRARYENAIGSLRLVVVRPPNTTNALLTGHVFEAGPNRTPLEGATVTITEGPNRGRTATTDTSGVFGFPRVSPGTLRFEVRKDGYELWTSPSLAIDSPNLSHDATLLPVPPKNESGASATARCMDGSWTWATTRADACPPSGGIAYGVCPGPLCGSTITQ
jgi:hypothetical protein